MTAAVASDLAIAARWERIGPVLHAAVEGGNVAGLVALVAWREAVRAEAVGVQDIATGTPMRRDSIVRIASMTKPIIAAAAMMLVEEGRIALDDPVESFLPELADRRVLRTPDSPLDDTVPARRAITLDDLLTLRFGLGMAMMPHDRTPLHAAMATLGVEPGPDPLPVGPDEFMARIGRLPLMHQPGEAWRYHTGADVLAVLIARVAGMPLEAFLRQRIFAPLGMRDTGFSVPPEALDRLTTCYVRGATGLEVLDAARGGRHDGPMAFPNELVSTADDYLAFARMLLDEGRHPRGRLLSADSVRLMMTDHITPAQKAVSPFFPGFWERQGWGFGGAVTTAAGAGIGSVGSYGWAGGFGTSMLLDPREGTIAILLPQRLMRGPDDAALNGRFTTLAIPAGNT
ncbi:MAG TPA: serine hydrolase domain-containing protein [Acetobacteraceae bacterium]|nr:serine hydrolase domain-containing protein [Acetobacteraceae bacterium]